VILRALGGSRSFFWMRHKNYALTRFRIIATAELSAVQWHRIAGEQSSNCDPGLGRASKR
jgi:hypothetical protein